MSDQATPTTTTATVAVQPVFEARGLVKRYGHVTAMDGTDFELLPGEILAVIGDNGAGKSTLIKGPAGALIPDEGEDFAKRRNVCIFHTPLDARRHGIETVYQDLAVAPQLNIMENIFLGPRNPGRPGFLGSAFRTPDKKRMMGDTVRYMADLKIGIRAMDQGVGTLSGGQRQGVAVARSAAFARNVVIMDEPTAALGVKESRMVVETIRQVRDRGLPVILDQPYNMPQVFELADRIHIQRFGHRIAVVRPSDCSMSDAVAIMTGAMDAESLKTT